MNAKQQVLSLAISMTSLLNTTIFTSALSARAEVPTIRASTQIMAQASPSFIERTWQPDNNKFRVQFFKENNTYNGKIVWLPPGAETKDVKNPDPNLRSRNLIGSMMFKGFTYNLSKKQWTGGTVYIAEMGRTMKPKLWLEGDRLKMQISMGPMRKTFTLTAIK
jgi:Uncharacterized protein conserved in bacteria (DUF2147)